MILALDSRQGDFSVKGIQIMWFIEEQRRRAKCEGGTRVGYISFRNTGKVIKIAKAPLFFSNPNLNLTVYSGSGSDVF